MARKQPKPQQSSPNVDPHHGVGGSYAIAGGVNHDTGTEGARELVERTEHRVVKSVLLEEQERQAQAEREAAGEPSGE